MAEAKGTRKKSAKSAVQKQVQKFEVGGCVSVTIEIRRNCSESDKPQRRFAKMSTSADSLAGSPPMRTMSGGPTGSGGGGGEVLLSIYIDVNGS